MKEDIDQVMGSGMIRRAPIEHMGYPGQWMQLYS